MARGGGRGAAEGGAGVGAERAESERGWNKRRAERRWQREDWSERRAGRRLKRAKKVVAERELEREVVAERGLEWSEEN